MFNQITIEGLLYFGAIGLSLIGLYGLLVINNVFRMVLALALFEAGANLILVLSGFRLNAIAPIILGDTNTVLMNDPVPQALVLTAIVIGVGVQALALALVFRVKKHYATLDMRLIRANLESEIAAQAGVEAPASHQAPVSVKAGEGQ